MFVMGQLHVGQDQAPAYLPPFTPRAWHVPVPTADQFPSTPGDGSGNSGGGDTGSNTPSYSGQTYVYVDTQPTDQIGALVYAVSGEFAVKSADADYPYPVVGILTQKISERRGIVQRYGNVTGIFSGLTPDARGYLGHNGAIIYPPLPANDIRYSQQVGYATDANTFFVQLTGQVIGRDVSGHQLALYVGQGAPQDGSSYQQQNLYIDRLTGGTYTSPTAAGDASAVYVGDGPPPADTSTLTAMDVFFDADAQALYARDDTQTTPGSEILLGHGQPADTIDASTFSFYVDETSGLIYTM